MIRAILVFSILSAITVCSQAQGQTLKFLNYNALHGFSGDSVLMKRFVSWVKKVDPDIIAFQEMNDYTQNDLGLLAESYGHPYAVIMNQEFGVPVTHPIAITSRYPILSVERVMDNMWHGYLYAFIGGRHFFVTHLAPFTLKDRQKDIDKILAQASLIPAKERIIIAGDMNALSPVDSAQYGSRLLTSMKRIEGRLEPKSGLPIVRGRTIYRNNLNGGRIDYSVMQRLIDEGYQDTFYLTNKKFKNSVPAGQHVTEKSILRRIDYVWANDAAAREVVFADILQDDATAVLSDHYPVLVEFNVKRKKQSK